MVLRKLQKCPIIKTNNFIMIFSLISVSVKVCTSLSVKNTLQLTYLSVPFFQAFTVTIHWSLNRTTAWVSSQTCIYSEMVTARRMQSSWCILYGINSKCIFPLHSVVVNCRIHVFPLHYSCKHERKKQNSQKHKYLSLFILQFGSVLPC